MSDRPPNPPWDALAAVTGSHSDANRGELSMALKIISSQTELRGEDLAVEIHAQAVRYRQVMGEALLTPTALAKHWTRVEVEAQRSRGTNQHSKVDCETCGGDRMVVVGTREEGKGRVEEMAPCPDCNPRCRADFRRYDGSMVKALDPARVREMVAK